ncbi:hypothetical protein EYC55_20505 [Xanthomonas oryzae]|nr:hypothetical protein EYC55_20505 [Xanthomonas oryzae]
MHTDQLDWSLPAHRRRTLGGLDATRLLARTYVQRVLRGWAGKGRATRPQIERPSLALTGNHALKNENDTK